MNSDDSSLERTDPGLFEALREQEFEQRKIAFIRKYQNLHEGQSPPLTTSRYGPVRDRWLRRFARTPRDQRTRAQWRKFERYHKQIFGTNEEWGDYD